MRASLCPVSYPRQPLVGRSWCSRVAQLRLKISAPLWCDVQHVPHWIEQVVMTVLLPRLRQHIEQFATPEVTDCRAVALEHIEHWHVPFLARLEPLLFP